jgi:hypothetical protein
MTTEDMVVDVSQDWLQACSVQEHFMRGPALNNCWVNLSASCRQMRALGGDYYNFAFLGDGQIAMLVGDASGKGVAAALMMASVQASVRTAAQFTGDNLAGLFRAAKSGELTASSRLRRPAGRSPRMNSLGRSLMREQSRVSRCHGDAVNLDSMDAFSGGVQTDDATVAVLRAI